MNPKTNFVCGILHVKAYIYFLDLIKMKKLNKQITHVLFNWI